MGDWGEEADKERAAVELERASRAARPTWHKNGVALSPGQTLLALMAPLSQICGGPEDMISWEDYRFAFKASPGSFFDLIYFQRQLRKVC